MTNIKAALKEAAFQMQNAKCKMQNGTDNYIYWF
jgi:hypothetical protein